MRIDSVTSSSLLTLAATLVMSSSVIATPIAISDAGYWLETVGPNTIGLAGGGMPGGVITTLFVADTDPKASGGTTAVANYSGTPAGTVFSSSSSPNWAMRVVNPTATQLGALTVDFSNGGDTASFTGRVLSGLAPMPLVQNLTVDGSVEPYGPVVSWALPAAPPGVDIDFVQLVFYSNATNLEVGNRVLLGPTATSFDLAANALPQGFDLTVNVRLVDLYDDFAPFSTGNILSESRAYVNYLAPIPEPTAMTFMMFGLAALGLKMRRIN